MSGRGGVGEADGESASAQELQAARERIQRAETVVRETMAARQRAELQTLEWIEKLLDPISTQELKMSSRFFRPQDFDEVIVERNLAEDCGYPLCTRKRVKIRQKFKISTREKKVYSLDRLSSFCGQEHLQDAVYFRSQLSEDPVWAREGITDTEPGRGRWERDIKLFGDADTPHEAALGSVLKEVADLKLNDDVIENTGHDANVQDSEEHSNHNHESVEGYVSKLASLALKGS